MKSRRYRLYLSLIVVLTLTAVSFGAAGTTVSHNVRDFGAVADGQTKDTQAIRKALDAAVKAGGGTVYFPAGQYLTGPIHLQSNITLYLDAGALLKFSTDFNDYLPMVKSRWEGVECTNFSPQIYAYKAENIAIVGSGTIDGQGKPWWDSIRRQTDPAQEKARAARVEKFRDVFVEANKESPARQFYAQRGSFLRPPMIQPLDCRRVHIEGVKLQNPPFWTCNPVYCDDVTITGISVQNPADSPNTDGINPDSCRNVHIANCHISVGDDCITIKSGRNEDGRRVARPCENITITNCTMLDGHGGVVIGSEMSGGVKKVTISNCVFDGTDRGIRLKTARGRGGAVEDIRVSNIVMSNIQQAPIHIDMMYEKVPPEAVSERTPVLRDLHFSNITVKGARAAGYIVGLEEMPVENLILSDIRIDAETGFTCRQTKGLAFHNVCINTKKGPALVCENAENLEIEGLRTLMPHEDSAAMELRNVRGAYIRGCWAAPGTKTFLTLKGDKSRDVVLQANYLKHAASPVAAQEGFPDSALSQQ